MPGWHPLALEVSSSAGLRYLLPVAVGILVLGMLAGPVSAQDTGSDQQHERTAEEQQKQLDDLQKKVDEQARLLQQYMEQSGTATDAPYTDPVQAVSHGRNPISQMDKHDLVSPTSSNVTYFGPSLKGMMPDSRTKVGVHGLIEFQIFHDTVGLNNNRFDTATIPVDGGPPQTKFNVNPTQFAVSTVTGAGDGQLNTWFSIDLNGELDRPHPRLRIAFAEYVNYNRGWGLLGGQTYSTMLDLRAVPEALDFALPAGLWQLRQPLLRVTQSREDSRVLEVSLETPESVTYEGAETRTRLPDFSAAGTWLTGGNYFQHIRVAVIARDLRAEGEGGGTDSELGWALSGSAKTNLPFMGARDNFKFTVHTGDGYGTQLKGGPKEGVFNPSSSELETIGVFGAYGGLQHFWSDRYRSNFLFGHVEASNPDFVDGDTMKNTTYVSVNFVWSPFPTAKLGVEYLWGQRKDQDGASGTSNRFLLSSMTKF
jgi:hypothetical protein